MRWCNLRRRMPLKSQMRSHSFRQPLLLVTLLGAALVAAACENTPSKTAAETSSAATQARPTNGAVAYDSARKIVVLVTPGRGPLVDALQTWTWDGHLWSRKAPSISPPARAAALFAYDESRRVTVLQGGVSRSTLTDTWEWNGSTWTKRTPAHSPDAAQEPGSMAYEPGSHRMLLYQWPQQTWSWDGNDWTQLKPLHVPGVADGKLVFDGKRLVLIGGSFNGGTETWGWNGTDWSRLVVGRTSVLPLNPVGFNDRTGNVVLYGGGPGDDTWIWDGTTWVRAHPKHSPAGEVAELIYVGSLGRLVGFAGTDVGAITGIYAWDGSDWSAVGPGSPPAVTAGKGVLSLRDAAALVRRTVTKTSPVLLPLPPAGVNEATVTADSTGFSLRAMNDDRSIEVMISITVPGNSNLGADNKTIAFRHASAFYQYIAGDPTGRRDMWWTERPGYWPVPALKDQTGVPYVLSATGLTESQFFALAATLS